LLALIAAENRLVVLQVQHKARAVGRWSAKDTRISKSTHSVLIVSH
jgi:hypothetical protein